MLTEHGVAWTWNDLSALDAQAEAAFGFLPLTAPFLYVRLMGDLETKFRPDGERQFRYGSLLWPRDGGLENWAHRLAKHLDDTRNIYVMVNNHYEGFSPLTCQRLGQAAGHRHRAAQPRPARGPARARSRRNATSNWGCSEEKLGGVIRHFPVAKPMYPCGRSTFVA